MPSLIALFFENLLPIIKILKKIHEIYKKIIDFKKKVHIKASVIAIIAITLVCFIFKISMIYTTFKLKQDIASNFRKNIEPQLHAAVKSVANLTKGSGYFIIEYIKWEESGNRESPQLKGNVEYVVGYDSQDKIVLDMKAKALKNEGLTPITYTPDMSRFLLSTTSAKPDFKTLDDYLSAGVGVEDQFIKETNTDRGTFYGNFYFKVYGMYGSTIFDNSKKRIGRFILLADETATKKIRIDTGLQIMDDLSKNTQQAIND